MLKHLLLLLDASETDIWTGGLTVCCSALSLTDPLMRLVINKQTKKNHKAFYVRRRLCRIMTGANLHSMAHKRNASSGQQCTAHSRTTRCELGRTEVDQDFNLLMTKTCLSPLWHRFTIWGHIHQRGRESLLLFWLPYKTGWKAGGRERQSVLFPLHRRRKCCLSRGVGTPKPAARGSAGRRRPPWQDAGKGDCGKLHGIRAGV